MAKTNAIPVKFDDEWAGEWDTGSDGPIAWCEDAGSGHFDGYPVTQDDGTPLLAVICPVTKTWKSGWGTAASVQSQAGQAWPRPCADRGGEPGTVPRILRLLHRRNGSRLRRGVPGRLLGMRKRGPAGALPRPRMPRAALRYEDEQRRVRVFAFALPLDRPLHF